MMTIRTARRIAGVLIAAATLGACAQAAAQPTVEAPAEIDRNCVLAAQNKLRMLIGLNAADGRALPAPDFDRNPTNHRIVEVDAVNGKLSVTYVFVCVSGKGFTSVSPMGHK